MYNELGMFFYSSYRQLKSGFKEDPLLYQSKATNRGPLPVDWLERVRSGELKDTVMCRLSVLNIV